MGIAGVMAGKIFDMHKVSSIATIFFIMVACNPVYERFEGERIDLSGKKLTIVPDSIFLHKELVSLELGCGSCIIIQTDGAGTPFPWKKNYITELPEKIGMFKKLKELILNGNNLRTLPPTITELKELEILDISMNTGLSIETEIEKLKQLPKLRILKIYDIKIPKNMDSVQTVLGKKVKIIYKYSRYFIKQF